MIRSVAVLALVGLITPANAQVLKLRQTSFLSEKKNLVESLTLQGDLRLRHDNANKRSAGNLSRSRNRYRLRLDALVDLPENLRIGLQLASGSGNQVSPNQSFDNLGSGKGIVINRIYLRWQTDWLTLSGGKIKNPRWWTYSADVVFDRDYNPEGFGQQFKWGKFALNTLQMVVDEDSGSEAQQWLFSQQLVAQGFGLTGGVAWHEWVNERFSTFGQNTTLEGNRRVTDGSLANDFSVLELTGEFRRGPVRLQGTFIKNTSGVSARSNAGDTARDDIGYQVGAIAGKAKAARSWEVTYFLKWLETDATPADISDSDFGDGGTNRRGHIVWLAYNPRDWMQLKTKYFYTVVIDENLAPGADDINRVLLDLSIKF